MRIFCHKILDFPISKSYTPLFPILSFALILMIRIKHFFMMVFSYLRKKKWRSLGGLLILLALCFWLFKNFLSPQADTSFVSNDYTVMTGEVANSLSLA